MKEPRALALLVGHALADGRPTGPLLTGASGANARAAARALEAGALPEGLRRLGFPDDLVRLAERWPAALPAAQRRLAALPSSGYLLLRVLDILAIVAILAVFQFQVAVLLEVRVMPTLDLVSTTADGPGVPGVAGVAVADLIVMLLALPVGLGAWGWAQRGRSGWPRHLRRAREVALASALLETGAPAPVRTGLLGAGSPEAAGAADLEEADVLLGQALADAEVSLRRLRTTTRVLGYGLILALSLALLVRTYGAIIALSRLP
jgi:hypothetical protein